MFALEHDWDSLFRKYGEPAYVQIYTKGEGLAEFLTEDEMRHVIKKLDDTKFRNEYIHLKVRNAMLSLPFLELGRAWAGEAEFTAYKNRMRHGGYSAPMRFVIRYMQSALLRKKETRRNG